MTKKLIFYTLLILFTGVLVVYAQEQDIAESFGLYSKGIDYYHKGKLYEAQETLEQAVRLDPRNDEAQGYLDLVKAEINMREKGRLNSYEEASSLKREIDNNEYKRYENIPDPNMRPGEMSDKPGCEYFDTEPVAGNKTKCKVDQYVNMPDPNMRPGEMSDAPQCNECFEEEPVAVAKAGNAKGKISGELRLSMGLTSEDFLWKDANSDLIGVPYEENWRYLWGQDRYNTYDKRIYDSLEINLDTKNQAGFNVYSQIAIDPWTFVGTQDVRITSTLGGDYADIKLKYWSNYRSTINEVYRSNKGNIINLSEIKIKHDLTTPNTPTGIADWSTNYNPIPTGTEIDRQYMPIRKFWVDYINEDRTFNGRVFLMADQAQAFSSDDPLRLSNNHVYWEESPWLDEYDPSRLFYPDSGLTPLKQGRWVRRLSFYTKKSNEYNDRLTFLRGVSLNGDMWPGSTYNMTAATPMSLWDDYENVTSIPAAFRTKTEVTPEFTLGSIYTFKGGMNAGTMESVNQVLGLDATYNIASEWDIVAELAGSETKVDEANDMKTSYDGVAYSLGLLSKTYKTALTANYMAQDFYPGLSNYRYTRKEAFYSKHIRFSKMLDRDEAIAVGDGIDRGRMTFNFKTEGDFLDDNLNTKLNFRNVHKDNGKNLETVTRVESTLKVTPKMTLKALGSYQKLPKTIAGLDPLFYAKTSYSFTDYYSEDDRFVENSSIVDGKDPSLGNVGLGIRYELMDNLAWEGVYERTNDPQDTPRGLFNNSYVTTETKNGMLLDKMVPFLYSQGFFDLPPYDYYSIYKTKLIYRPFSKLTGILSFTRNIDKHTIGLDDNVNHIGLELDYQHSEKLSLGFKYAYSKIIDVFRQHIGEGVHYDGHHNIFVEMAYSIDEDQEFIMEFGEFAGYAPVEGLYQMDKWSLSTLDTQHIFRVHYNRKF